MAVVESEKTAALTPDCIVPDDSIDFFRALRMSRLLTEDEVQALEAKQAAHQLSAICDMAIKDGTLTPYQIKRLRSGDPRGLVVGSYKILEELGRGSIGQVFKAKHALMDRIVALKVTAPEDRKEKTARDQFRREVAAITRLNHPNVAATYDANEIDGVLYLAMEYVCGSTLHRHTTEEGPLSISLACSLLLQTASALQHAHENGLVHRDIKPGNLMISPLPRSKRRSEEQSYAVKVVDFGLARLSPRDDRQLSTIMCRDGATMGTPAFISPEQIRDLHKTDIRSDLYSLGCTFYFALTGHLPFEGATTQATLSLHLEREARPIRSWRSEIPLALAGVIQRMMAKNPADRFQTPAELIDVLNGLIVSGTFSQVDTDDAPLPTRPYPKRVPEAAETQSVPQDLRADSGRIAMPSGINPLDGKVLDKPVRSLWRAWSKVVENSLLKLPQAIREDQYKLLYKSLLQAIRTPKGEGAEAEPARYVQLLTVVEPWVSLKALSTQDTRTLASLAQTCRSLDGAIWPPTADKSERGFPFLTCAIVLAISIGLLARNATEVSRWAANHADASRWPQYFAGALLIPILLLMFLVARRKGESL